MKIDASTQKISTHITGNIIFTLLCFPPIWMIFMGIGAFVIPPKSRLDLVAVDFTLIIGIIIAFVCAHEVKRLASGDHHAVSHRRCA